MSTSNSKEEFTIEVEGNFHPDKHGSIFRRTGISNVSVIEPFDGLKTTIRLLANSRLRALSVLRLGGFEEYKGVANNRGKQSADDEVEPDFDDPGFFDVSGGMFK